MPSYRIRVINHSFSACDDHEMPSPEAAGEQGIRAALAIGVEEVAGGKPFFGAEVRIEDGQGTVARYVVSIGASPLQEADQGTALAVECKQS